MAAFAVAVVLIALAELGDKTQLLALCLAAKYRTSQVLVGILGATLLVHLLSTAVGEVAGSLVPELWLRLATGALFVAFGLWTLRGDGAEESRETGRYGPVLATGIAFFLAELGDKTQIMTMSVAADPSAALRTLGALGAPLSGIASAERSAGGTFVGVWLGSTAGMMLADGLAILVGSALGRRLPERLITRVAGAFFILFGVAAFATAVASWRAGVA